MEKPMKTVEPMRLEEVNMKLEAHNTSVISRTDASLDCISPDWRALHLQEELLDLLRSLTESCADLRFRLQQIEARERVRDAIRKPYDLGIDY